MFYPCVALASQCLPEVEKLSAKSISQWAAQAGPWLIQRLQHHEGPWRLHVFHVPAPDRAATSARCRLIEQAIESLLRKKQRRLLRTWRRESEAKRQSDEWLVQVGLETPTQGYLSAATADEWCRLRRCISRYPGGQVEVPADRRAPSRAFAKLAEVETRLARPIGPAETCVDLGSSPGSWAYWALSRGATIVAVDRSPLRADLMRHERLTFVRGDAFRYRPTQAVDWLLCDVIAFPGRTIELVERWLAEGWCRHFCVTIKFRGLADYDRLEPLKAKLSEMGHDFYLRRLTSNKNEVMAFGTAAGAGEPICGGL
ncbi:MAG TPA: SAM-dependent methyltransferase [Pirellulales bacterium]|nr:SAM-dependent methyltransferase [Pirellulales bacterium]